MKIPTMLLQRVLLDVGLQLSDTIDKDYREICSRYQHEGMSFLTITLPLLDDALLQGLSQGRLTRSMFTGFKAVSRRRSLPALLSGFFRRVFDDDGYVLDAPDVCAIYAIRQVARLFKKVELPCSEPRVKAAYERYISNDAEVDWRSRSSHIDNRLFGIVSGILWSGLELFAGELYCFPAVFGPGATAERVKRNARHTIRQWPKRSEGSFPSSFHALPREDCDSVRDITYLQEEEEQPVRVVQVPKTLKTPRTISVEPSYMMLMQQSIAKPLMVYLESRTFGFQSIRFVDQSVNNRLARAGSVDGSLATIDLKDASDMVSNDLVEDIFRGPCPTFLQLIQDCRTTKAQLPDKTILPLKKFASMGSAMCFPIESMVFFTIIMYALVKESGRVPSRRLLQALAKDVAVYGDDIIVPSLMAPVVMEALEAFGLKVNHDKSFQTGLFRESCGGDYYNGVDITPAYVRQWDDTGTLSKPSHLVAYAALSNTFYMKGLWHACQYLRDGLSRVRTQIPLARHPIGVIHFASFLYDSNVTWDSKLHGYRVRGLKVRSRKEDDCPTNMAGFLSLAFRAETARIRIRGLKKTVNMVPRSRGFSTCDNRYQKCSMGSDAHRVRYLDAGIGSFGNEEVPSSILPSRPDCDWKTDTTGETDVELFLQPSRQGEHEGGDRPLYWRNSYSQLVGNGRPVSKIDQCFDRSGFYPDWLSGSIEDVGEKLPHLRIKTGTSLYTSDRPHALSLKRGWTASQAGLQW